jgi:hypothetical protein
LVDPGSSVAAADHIVGRIIATINTLTDFSDSIENDGNPIRNHDDNKADSDESEYEIRDM